MCKVTARRSTNGLKNKFTDFSIVSTGNKSSNSDGTIMQIVGPQHGIVYLMKDPRDPLLHIYLFESDCIEEVSEFALFLDMFVFHVNGKCKIFQSTSRIRQLNMFNIL